MAGYLGTRAVLLSTTAADVTGDMTVAGATTLSGAFTSLGIDDNATSTAITIDASENVGIGTDSPAAPLDIDGEVEFDNIKCAPYSVGTISVTNGVWANVVALDTAFAGVDSADMPCIISIFWSGGAYGVGGTAYWAGCYSTVYGSEIITNTYNATPAFPLIMNGSMHHTGAGFPEFQVNSDNSAGSYGKPTLGIKVGFTGTLSGVYVQVRRLL